LTEFKYNRVLLILIFAGLLASLVIGWQRYNVEENNSAVEMVLDYEDIVSLAQTEGVPEHLLMQQFKDAGINSLAVYDTTLEKLAKSGKLTVMTGGDLLGRYRTGEKDGLPSGDPSGTIVPSRVYIFAAQESGGLALFEEVKEDLCRRLGTARVKEMTLTGNRRGLAVDANYEKLIKENLGLSTQEMRAVTAYGYNIIARPSNFVKVRPDDINAVFDRLKGFSNITGIMFVGEEVLGYPDLLNYTAEKMQQMNLTLYMIEHPLQLQFLKQDGLLPLAALSDYRCARVYVIPKDEQPKLKVDDAVHRWAITVDQERNIRVDLLRKYDKPEAGLSLVETNLKYVNGVRQSLIDRGFTIDRAGVYRQYYPNSWLLIVIAVGATAACVLLLTLIRPFASRYQYFLLVIVSLVFALLLLKGSNILVKQAVAMVSAITFPVLSMTWQLDRWRTREPAQGSFLTRIIVDGVGGLVVATLLSIVGGLYVGAILGDIRFILEAEIFRGVKLTFVMPLILITLVYLTRYNLFGKSDDVGKGVWGKILKILNYPIYLKTLLGIGVLAVVGWVYVGRSGHTAGVPVPGLEIKLRTFLENAMYARPREKEFLIGHPSFLLAVMAIYRKWPLVFHYILVVGATMGQGSLVETFAHIRTPILMSLVRGLEGMALGAVIGIIAVIAVQVLHYLSFMLGRRSAVDE